MFTGVDNTLTIDTLKSSETMRQIAATATAPYTLVYMKEQYMEMGLYALERMLRIAECTGAGMVYLSNLSLKMTPEWCKPASKIFNCLLLTVLV